MFKANGLVFRRITPLGEPDYRELIASGLYAKAVDRRLLVSHEDVDRNDHEFADGLVLLPQQLVSISYPYEWCFSQLRDAALLVLDLQELALENGMSLKDATAYNVQFHQGRPIFIDTSSFERYETGAVWRPYRQFCEHFLAPLLLMSRVAPTMGLMLRDHLDGIPLELVNRIAKVSVLHPALYMHVAAHGKAKTAAWKPDKAAPKLPLSSLLGLLQTLRQAIRTLRPPSSTSQWSDYSSATSYDRSGSEHKHNLVSRYLGELAAKPKLVWDLGANAGEFSRIFSGAGIETVAWDMDANAVERNYRQVRSSCETSLLPLVQDFTNPSPALGWNGEERMSFFERAQADLVVALALIHHLVIGNSVPLQMAAEFFARVGPRLIIEFVDPEDPRVVQLKSTRSDTHDYDLKAFESAFSRRFDILRKDEIQGSRRTLYLMSRKDS